MHQLLIFFLALSLTGTLRAADTLRLFFVGDVMGHGGQIDGALLDGGDSVYQYRPVFAAMKKVISQADMAVANLEVTLAGPPYSGYPQFSSPDALAVALKDAGFDVLVTANNHSLDRGRKGLERTVKVLDSLRVRHTGVFSDSAQRVQRVPLIFEQKGFRVALLNYTYGTNGLTVQYPNVVNYIDTAQIRADHVKARSMHPDLIITCIHWGIEYERQERAEQRTIARFLASVGSDMIIGSHPHVVQPFERIRTENGDIPVIYSLGNVVSNQRERYRDGGIIFKVVVVREGKKVSLARAGYEPFWVYRYDVRGRYQYRIIPLGLYHQYPHLFRIPAEDVDRMLQFEADTKELFPDLPVDFSYTTDLP